MSSVMATLVPDFEKQTGHKVTIDNGDGIILEEHLLGRDLSQEMEN